MANSDLHRAQRSVVLFESKQPPASDDIVPGTFNVPGQYVPSKFRLSDLQLEFKEDLLKMEDTRAEAERIIDHFHQEKMNFARSAGRDSEQIAILTVKAATTTRMHRIFKDFWHLICILIRFYRDHHKMIAEGSNRSERAIAAGILIYLVNKRLPESFFTWMGRTAQQASDWILTLCQKRLPTANDEQNIPNDTTIQQPLIETEFQLADTIFHNHIDPLFLPCTMIICQHHSSIIIEKEEEYNLKIAAKKRKIIQSSEDTEQTLSKNSESALAQVVLTLMRKEQNDIKKDLNKAIRSIQNFKSKNSSGGRGSSISARPQTQRTHGGHSKPGRHGQHFRNGHNHNGNFHGRLNNNNNPRRPHNGGRGPPRGRGRGHGRGGLHRGGRGGYGR